MKPARRAAHFDSPTAATEAIEEFLSEGRIGAARKFVERRVDGFLGVLCMVALAGTALIVLASEVAEDQAELDELPASEA